MRAGRKTCALERGNSKRTFLSYALLGGAMVADLLFVLEPPHLGRRLLVVAIAAARAATVRAWLDLHRQPPLGRRRFEVGPDATAGANRDSHCAYF